MEFIETQMPPLPPCLEGDVECSYISTIFFHHPSYQSMSVPVPFSARQYWLHLSHECLVCVLHRLPVCLPQLLHLDGVVGVPVRQLLCRLVPQSVPGILLLLVLLTQELRLFLPPLLDDGGLLVTKPDLQPLSLSLCLPHGLVASQQLQRDFSVVKLK